MLKFLIVVITILYPFTIVFMPEYSLYTQASLGILSLIGYVFLRDLKYLCTGIFFIFVVFLQNLKYFYPVFVNLIFFTVFSLSLKRTPVITKLASLRHELNDEIKIYTKKLTIIWMCFFVANGGISYFLTMFEDKSFWAVYCGLISYILMGLLFFGEIFYRKFVLRV